MKISDRDVKNGSRILNSQSGQAIVEYILVLIVTVAIILGALYQLNTAFKVWSHNYFGEYLACLLETGELPSIGGTPGDSGVCAQMFKPFSIKDGRPLLAKGGKGGNGNGGRGIGAREGGVYSSRGTGGLRFVKSSNGFGHGNQGAGAGGKNGKSDSTYTGNTGVSSYGGGYSPTYRQNDDGRKERLDNQFAFDKESEDKQKRNTASVNKSTSPEGEGSHTIKAHFQDRAKDKQIEDDKPMTFGNFIRILIIAAIIIALVVLIGGQMLQVGKSME